MVILLFQLRHSLFPPSRILSRHEPSTGCWWKSYTFPPTKLQVLVSKAIVQDRYSHDSLGSIFISSKLTPLSTSFWTSAEYHNSDKDDQALPQNSKKYHFANVSVVINSFSLNHWHNVSHLIFAQCCQYSRKLNFSRHFNYVIFVASRN